MAERRPLVVKSDGQLEELPLTDSLPGATTTGLIELKGDQDCSANPNYPAADKGDAYYVTVAGKIGGASGKSVDVGDVFVAKADNAGGNEAAVGTSWFVLEHNLVGALLAANNLSDLASAGTARTNLGLGSMAVQSSGAVNITGGTLIDVEITLLLDDAYGAGWNGSLEPPTKNAVYDKIETLGGSGMTAAQVGARVVLGI